MREYFQSGAEQVWHLLPPTRQARVFTSPAESVLLEPDDLLDGGNIVPGFSVRAGDLFDIGIE